MKKRVLSLIAVLALASIFGACSLLAPAAQSTAAPTETIAETAVEPDGEPTAAPAEAAPEGYDGITFNLTGLMGETVDDSILRSNKLTMVNFWATWCGPCVAEIPALSQLNEDYADKGFGIIGVLTSDQNVEGAKEFLTEKGVSYPVVNLEGVFAEYAADIYGIPATLFFDADGKQVGDMVVGGMEYEDWAKLVDSLLEQVS